MQVGNLLAANNRGVSMLKSLNGFVFFLSTIALSCSTAEASAKQSQWKLDQAEFTGEGPAVMWLNPSDIASRDLFYGPGGRDHQPLGTFAFVEERSEEHTSELQSHHDL